jgi:hypothetical protein
VPLILLTFFGYFTYVHVRQLGHGSSYQGRLQRIERQITLLIITQTLLCVITSLPYGAQYLYTGITLTQTKDGYRLALEAFIQHVVRLNLYASSAAPFYIYISLSSEVRRMAFDLICCRRINNNTNDSSHTMNPTAGQAVFEIFKMKPITVTQTKPNEK